MQDSNKLIKLVEQAACSINMLDPTDLSELDKLQKILEEIDESIIEISDGPAALLQEAKGTTADASEALQEMVTDQAKDAEASVETISQAVTTLQTLTDQIEKAVDQPGPESPQATTETATKTKAKTKTVIETEPEVVVEVEPEAVVENEPETVGEALFSTRKSFRAQLNWPNVYPTKKTRIELLEFLSKYDKILEKEMGCVKIDKKRPGHAKKRNPGLSKNSPKGI